MESEEPVQEHLAELFSRISPDCILDVGANAGQYAALLRDHGYQGWIVSFEPVRRTFEDLAELASADPRWRVHKLALGAHAERRTIAVPDVTQLASFRSFSRYASEELPIASDVASVEEVEVRTLNDSWDDFLEGLPQKRVFLKLDTQGWDLEVVEGAKGVLDRLVGLQLEASLRPVYEGAPSLAETVERVSALGFDLTGAFPVSRDSLFRLIEVDCVFVNSRHPEAESWRRDTWALLSARLREQVAAVVPAGSRFVLIDDAALGIDDFGGRSAIPFLEREGEYYGAPEDGEQAVRELADQVARGVRYLAIAWPCLWWLEEYPDLSGELHSSWRCVSESGAVKIFELISMDT